MCHTVDRRINAQEPKNVPKGCKALPSLSALSGVAAGGPASHQYMSELSGFVTQQADELAGSQQLWFLDVPLGGKVLESSCAVLPGQVLVELVLQGVQTVAVTGAGAKLGDVEAGRVGHVDHESIREDHQVELLREARKQVR